MQDYHENDGELIQQFGSIVHGTQLLGDTWITMDNTATAEQAIMICKVGVREGNSCLYLYTVYWPREHVAGADSVLFGCG